MPLTTHRLGSVTRPMSGPVRVFRFGCPRAAGSVRGRRGGAVRAAGVVLDEGSQCADLAFEGEVALVGVVQVADLGAQGPGVDGLHDEVGDAEAEGGGGQFVVGAVAGEQDDGDVLGLFHAPHVADHVEAADAGHAHIEQKKADPAAEHLLECLVTAGGAGQQIAQRRQGALQCVERVLVIVDDEDLGFRRHGPASLPRGQPAYVRALTGRARQLTRSAQRSMPRAGAHVTPRGAKNEVNRPPA